MWAGPQNWTTENSTKSICRQICYSAGKPSQAYTRRQFTIPIDSGFCSPAPSESRPGGSEDAEGGWAGRSAAAPLKPQLYHQEFLYQDLAKTGSTMNNEHLVKE